jgi:hypothetical protein
VTHEVQPAEPDDCGDTRAAAIGWSLLRDASVLGQQYHGDIAGVVIPPGALSGSFALNLAPRMKFSIRDLFLVTVIVALVLGWWVDRSRLAREVDRLQDFLHGNFYDSNIGKWRPKR